jgi:hypothetical protein
MKYNLPTLVSTLVITTLATSIVSADTITAIPPRHEITLDPGQTITLPLKVQNGFSTSQLFSIQVDDFIVYDAFGTPVPVAESMGNRFSLRRWITAPSVIPVDAGETQELNITISVPEDAIPGGRYAMITYQPSTDIKPGDLKDTASIIGQRVGSLILVNVSGDLVESLSITRFRTDKFQEYGPVSFTGTVRNDSYTHFNPTGKIEISDFFGRQVASLPVSSGNIFPEAVKDFSADWDQKWGYGRYKADLSLAYGLTGGVLTATIFFWLFPIRMVIYILTIIISVLAIIILINYRNRKHQEQLEQEVSELKHEIETLEHDQK